MPVPSLVTDLSATIASNSPAGSDNVFPDLDGYLRSLSGFLASIRDNSGNGWVSPYLSAANPNYTGTLTGGTGVVNLGSGQLYKDASGNVGIGTATPAAKLQVVGGNVLLDNTTGLAFKTAGGASCDAVKLTAADILQIGGGGATTAVQLWTGGVERTRVDASGNFLVGTTTAVEKVTLNQGNYYALRTGGAKLRLADQFNEVSFESVPVGSSSDAIFKTSALERMRLDQNGNLALGVVPSAWGGGFKALQVSNGTLAGYASGSNVQVEVLSNAYQSSLGTYNYISTATASQYRQISGEHQWKTAPSGTAGNAITFTQAMTLDASGRLGIGQTSPSQKLHVSGTAANTQILVSETTGYGLFASANTGGNTYFGLDSSAGAVTGTAYATMVWRNESQPIVFGTTNTARARIDSSGNLLIISTGGLGYGTGSGGAVTQITSRTTGVTLNKTNGAITLVSAAGTATWQSFAVTNSTVAATDTVIVNQKSGADKYLISVTGVNAGSFAVTFATTGGTTTEQPVFNFAVIKAVTA